ncbi:hypothetical protein SNEBB_001894 [Seison nebaliae]|nr:hypothetical protein SNEBB_001894 [Seison nebaliae]
MFSIKSGKKLLNSSYLIDDLLSSKSSDSTEENLIFRQNNQPSWKSDVDIAKETATNDIDKIDNLKKKLLTNESVNNGTPDNNANLLLYFLMILKQSKLTEKQQTNTKRKINEISIDNDEKNNLLNIANSPSTNKQMKLDETLQEIKKKLLSEQSSKKDETCQSSSNNFLGKITTSFSSSSSSSPSSSYSSNSSLNIWKSSLKRSVSTSTTSTLQPTFKSSEILNHSNLSDSSNLQQTNPLDTILNEFKEVGKKGLADYIAKKNLNERETKFCNTLISILHVAKLAATVAAAQGGGGCNNDAQTMLNGKTIDCRICHLDETPILEIITSTMSFGNSPLNDSKLVTPSNSSNDFNNSRTKKTHICPFCYKAYSRKYGLKIHLRVHTGYKPLQCTFCGRAFGDPSNLNKHVKLHSPHMSIISQLPRRYDHSTVASPIQLPKKSFFKLEKN